MPFNPQDLFEQLRRVKDTLYPKEKEEIQRRQQEQEEERRRLEKEREDVARGKQWIVPKDNTHRMLIAREAAIKNVLLMIQYKGAQYIVYPYEVKITGGKISREQRRDGTFYERQRSVKSAKLYGHCGNHMCVHLNTNAMNGDKFRPDRTHSFKLDNITAMMITDISKSTLGSLEYNHSFF